MRQRTTGMHERGGMVQMFVMPRKCFYKVMQGNALRFPHHGSACKSQFSTGAGTFFHITTLSQRKQSMLEIMEAG